MKEVKQEIVEMSLNGSGIRGVSWGLNVSTSTVINELKKGPRLSQVNHKYLEILHPEDVEIEFIRLEKLEDSNIEEAELDEM